MPPFTHTFIFPIGETLGGANIWSARMCGHLDRLGEPTAAVIHANPGWHPDEPLPIPSGTHRLICPGPPVTEARLRHVRRYAAEYERVLPAIIVPNFHEATYAACAELSRRRAAEMRVIGVAHGNNEAYFGTLERYESILHGFIAVSDEIEVELKRRLPYRAGDIHTRSCPVDVSETLTRPARFPGQPITVTYAGRITNHEKRVSDLTPLIRALDRLGVDFRFRIIGEGGYLATLKAEVGALAPDVRARVSIEGIHPPDAMPAIWAASDVCILVSSSEGTSLSMLEAMAAGCVPVVTRVSGTAAVIQEGVNGFAADVGDINALARHIQRLTEEPSVWRAASQAAHATTLERYAYPRYVEWFMGMIDSWKQAKPRSWPGNRRSLPRFWPGLAQIKAWMHQ